MQHRIVHEPIEGARRNVVAETVFERSTFDGAGPVGLICTGDLDCVNEASARAELLATVAEPGAHHQLVLYLGERVFVDVRGLDVLLDADRVAGQNDRSLLVVDPPRALRLMLDVVDEPLALASSARQQAPATPAADLTPGSSSPGGREATSRRSEPVPGSLSVVGSAADDIRSALGSPGKLRDLGHFEAAARDLLVAAITLLPTVSTASVTFRGIDVRNPFGGGGVRTLASLTPAALAVDVLQYDAREGPCLDVLDVVDPFTTVAVSDLAADHRWPRFAAMVHRAQPGVTSSLSCPLAMPADVGHGSLNLYFEDSQPDPAQDAHDGQRRDTFARLAAALFATGLIGLLHRRRAEHLETALDSNRLIGAAVGIMMVRYRSTYDNSFQMLRDHSQRTNRKLAGVAEEVVLTGGLPD